MIAAASAEEDRPGTKPSGPATPAERAAAARIVAAETIPGASICRGCALELVELMVRAAVEEAERDLLARIQGQTSCPN